MTLDQNQRRGLLIILSSPSGAGKSTLAQRLRKWDPDIAFSVSATTRPSREGEIHGQHYHFITEGDFKTMVANAEMVEHAHVFGHFYGSPKEPVTMAVDSGCDVLFDIDWQGAQQIRNSDLGSNTLSIFLLPPSIKELHRRLVSRNQDADEVIEKRMRKSWDEISRWDSYDFVLVNDDLNETEEQVKTIIAATRLRRLQQPELTEHVRKLQSEFEEL
ncbi:MAG: guanylate kinase [Tateyamaria sp.]|jgi:guanylate kinase|nr:guanylate kinase [Tateyamaria sp.]MCH9748911.1 guanylate kinase [Alphaproteobacteria bacterium]MBT5300956.1 guanylate kinase [Tateyamaria sp.]MBT6267579.1 guanylate kinase [Tateyamaria sp.]MBT6342215.1 guanylate kinase [Tateyamaria sp.]